MLKKVARQCFCEHTAQTTVMENYILTFMFFGHSDGARIAKEFEANQKRIKKELEKQDVLRRKVFFKPKQNSECGEGRVSICKYL